MKRPKNSPVYILSWKLMGSTNSCLRFGLILSRSRNFKYFRLNPLVASFDGFDDHLTRAPQPFGISSIKPLISWQIVLVLRVRNGCKTTEKSA